MSRQLYLFCYDITDNNRRYQVHKCLLGYRVSGQKSVFECWMTPAERDAVLNELLSLVDPLEDRIHVLQLDPRIQREGLGVAHFFRGGPFLLT